jgi:hypothetical protein
MGQQLTRQFILLRNTESGFYPFGNTVDSLSTSHRFFRRLTFEGPRLVRAEQFDTTAHLLDDIYSPAVVVFEYGAPRRPIRLAFFDKDGHKSVHSFLGCWSIQYKFDPDNKIIEERYCDTNGVLLKVPRDSTGAISNLDYQAPIVTYSYRDSMILQTDYDETGIPISTEELHELPCVPFFDCRDF